MERSESGYVHGTSFAWEFRNVREMGMKMSGGAIDNMDGWR